MQEFTPKPTTLDIYMAFSKCTIPIVSNTQDTENENNLNKLNRMLELITVKLKLGVLFWSSKKSK